MNDPNSLSEQLPQLNPVDTIFQDLAALAGSLLNAAMEPTERAQKVRALQAGLKDAGIDVVDNTLDPKRPWVTGRTHDDVVRDSLLPPRSRLYAAYKAAQVARQNNQETAKQLASSENELDDDKPVN